MLWFNVKQLLDKGQGRIHYAKYWACGKIGRGVSRVQNHFSVAQYFA